MRTTLNNLKFIYDGNLFYEIDLLDYAQALYKLNFIVVCFTEKI